jgi:hypothetical protein
MRFLYLIYFITCCFSLQLYATSSWTVFIYLEATDHLADMALKNLSDLARSSINSDITFIAQVHAFEHTAIRYKIEKNSLHVLAYNTLTSDDKQNFIDGATWAFTHYPSSHTMLILWNHGWGILEPCWDTQQHKWYLMHDQPAPLYLASAITHTPDPLYKGFLFNKIAKTYLTNTDLIDALHAITRLLPQQKLDIIGCDTCMGAQLETCASLAPYADYFIGSQSAAPKQGWDYYALGNHLTALSKPLQIVHAIITTYNEYYSKTSLVYSISAIDLKKIQHICTQLDQLATILLSQFSTQSALPASIIESRLNCFPFCFISAYADLRLWCTLLIDRLTQQDQHADILIINALKLCIHTFDQAIMAHKSSSQLGGKIYGLSIYFPLYTLDASYESTYFARHYKWFKFLQTLIKHSL